MKRISLTTIFLLIAPMAQAGVSMDIVRADMEGNEIERSHIASQGAKLRIDSGGGPYTSEVSMIFLGDRFLVVDHDERTYIVMDEAMVNEMSAKISEAMKQFEAQMAQMPPEQRAMAEEIMKSQMAAMSSMADAPPPRVEPIGPGEWEGTPCTRFAVFEGPDKSQDVCAAPLNQIAGSQDMMEGFMEMARFVQILSESLPGPLAAALSASPGAVIEQINGFPIHSVDYVQGEAASQSHLESFSEKDFDDSTFAPPEGYTLTDPFEGR